METTVSQPGGIQKLQDGLTALERARAGYSIAAAIRERGTAVRFGQIGEDTIACFDPDKNEVVVNEVLRDASLNVLVQHLTHEGTHVQWDRPNSIDQEYYAFKAEAEVWNELKGHETVDQCDQVSQMISLGEAEAKKRIRHALPYRNLPEYA
jgi:hypothetical protein